VDFDPQSRRTAAYRNGKGRGKDNSTLDDGITQGAIQLLVLTDAALKFEHEGIHEAARIALEALLAAQFPNGGFPQVWTGPVPARPVTSARFPMHDWRTEGRVKNYWDMYTLNDGLASDVAAALIDAHRVYRDPKYKAALVRLGDFLILAQLPDPQPAWAQQYNEAMEPIWARKFEPAAIAGHESQDVLDALLTINEQTGDRKYLEPVPRAVEYLQRSRLPDGRLARYYELETNRPLYMLRRGDVYTPTYDDTDLPGHYGWKWPSRLDEITARYRALQRGGPQANGGHTSRPAPDAGTVRRIIADLDSQGRWISTYEGERLVGQPKFATGADYISSEVFSRNLTALSDYLAATSPRAER
jgi:PelA/Pel-15E family pectate lyase